MQFITLLALASSATALGINCRGSGDCHSASGSLLDMRNRLDTFAQTNGGRHYNEGQQIACDGDLCAFFQKGASGSASDAANLVSQIYAHGCNKCGSVPTQPGNNVNSGELTVNYVTNTCCAPNDGSSFCTCP